MMLRVTRTVARVGFVVLVFGALGGAGAQIAKHGKGYVFRMKFSKGQTIRYVMVMVSKAQGLRVRVPLTQKTISVEKGGKAATLSLSTGKAEMTMNGKPIEQQVMTAGRTITVTLDDQGHVQEGGSSQTSVSLPTSPIPIGGSWTADTSVSALGKPLDVTETYRLKGFQKIGKLNAAVLAVVIKSNGGFETSGTGTVWLNTADSSMVKSVSKITVTVGKISLPMDVEVVRK